MKTGSVAKASLLTALAVLLGYVEIIIPVGIPIPGIKLGLGNLVVITALYILDVKSAAAIAFLKAVICSLLFSGMTAMAYSLCGAALSIAAQAAAKKTGLFSVIGVSAVGGISHNAGQLLCAYFIVGAGALYYMPILCAAGAVTGILIGILAALIIKRGTSFFGKK